jgi:hypothetical protein
VVHRDGLLRGIQNCLSFVQVLDWEGALEPAVVARQPDRQHILVWDNQAELRQEARIHRVPLDNNASAL